jgi:anti-sigma B factor antagonist
MWSGRDGGTHVIRLAGELDLTTTEPVEQELRRVELTDAHVIAVDLRELTFIDSMGLRLLFQAGLRSSQGTNRLVLIRGSGEVQRIFEMCDLARRLPFVD